MKQLLCKFKRLFSPGFSIRLTLVLLILFVVSGAISCKEIYKRNLDEVIVQVWEKDELVSNGIIVGNGSEVLTILEYQDSIPDNLHIVQGTNDFEASVKAVDFRTGLALLVINAGPFRKISTGDALLIKPDQSVLVFGWSQPFEGFEVTDTGKRAIYGKPEFIETNAVTTDFTIDSPFRFGINYPAEIRFEAHKGIESREIITDLRGNVLGLVGNSYWGLFPPPSPVGWLPPVVSINAALDLLSEDADEQIWARGPTGFIFAGPNYNTAYGQATSYYDEAAIEIEKLLSTAGEPLSVAELQAENYTDFFPSEGKAVTALYALPVSLRNTNGDLLAQAKWIFIRWGVIGQPVYVVYGAAPYLSNGAFELTGDPTNLDLLVHPGVVRLEVVPP